MDPVSTAFSVIKGIMQAISMAQGAGYLGGASAWMDYAKDLAAAVGNFEGFVTTMATDPQAYDRIDALPQDEKEREIRRILMPEGWEAKEARIRRELGTA